MLHSSHLQTRSLRIETVRTDAKSCCVQCHPTCLLRMKDASNGHRYLHLQTDARFDLLLCESTVVRDPDVEPLYDVHCASSLCRIARAFGHDQSKLSVDFSV
ncbi:hypothetical protein MPSEU_000935800 [Mayamaea pseudoterrestris]|nr:hypothetical protein MPSEU_000935800 [Mayamaea pseudoterrestris]